MSLPVDDSYRDTLAEIQREAQQDWPPDDGTDDDCCADCPKLGECACYGSDDLIDCDLNEPMDEPEEEEDRNGA